MSDKNFIDKLTRFLLGDPVPVLTENDLQLIYDLSRKLDALAPLLAGAGSPGPPQSGPAAEKPAGTISPSVDGLDGLQEQVQKLAKTQFKANSLQEVQLAQSREVLENLEKSLAGQEKSLAELAKQREQAVEAAHLEMLKRILPVLDSLDAAFNSGRRQVLQLPMSKEARQAVIAWLDGIRLARLRLLDLLAAYHVQPIPTRGQPFDPHYHVAVATDTTGRAPEGIIVGEDRAGYASPTRVLREAEVIVARSVGAIEEKL